LIYEAGQNTFQFLEISPELWPGWLAEIEKSLCSPAFQSFLECSRVTRKVTLMGRGRALALAEAGATLLRQICKRDTRFLDLASSFIPTGETVILLELPDAPSGELEIVEGSSLVLLGGHPREKPESIMQLLPFGDDPQPWLGFRASEMLWMLLQEVLFKLANRDVLAKILSKLPRPELAGAGLQMLNAMSGVDPDRVFFLGEGLYIGLARYCALTLSRLAGIPAEAAVTSKFALSNPLDCRPLVVIFQADSYREGDVRAMERLPATAHVLLITDSHKDSQAPGAPGAGFDDKVGGRMGILEAGRWANAVMRPSLTLWWMHYLQVYLATLKGGNPDRPSTAVL
jgi:hypothetical protein